MNLTGHRGRCKEEVMSFVSGLDLGQVADPAALVVCEREWANAQAVDTGEWLCHLSECEMEDVQEGTVGT